MNIHSIYIYTSHLYCDVYNISVSSIDPKLQRVCVVWWRKASKRNTDYYCILLGPCQVWNIYNLKKKWFLVPMESVYCVHVLHVCLWYWQNVDEEMLHFSISKHLRSRKFHSPNTQWSGEGVPTICNFQMVICLCQHLYAIRDTLIVVIVRVSTL